MLIPFAISPQQIEQEEFGLKSFSGAEIISCTGRHD